MLKELVQAATADGSTFGSFAVCNGMQTFASRIAKQLIGQLYKRLSSSWLNGLDLKAPCCAYFVYDSLYGATPSAITQACKRLGHLVRHIWLSLQSRIALAASSFRSSVLFVRGLCRIRAPLHLRVTGGSQGFRNPSALRPISARPHRCPAPQPARVLGAACGPQRFRSWHYIGVLGVTPIYVRVHCWLTGH